MDLGDKQNVVVVFDQEGREERVARVGNTSAQVQRFFSAYTGAAVVVEAGTHSPWVSRLLQGMGHEVCVGNPRRLRAIWDSDDKSDERDARVLGMMYRLEPRLLHAIKHRGEQAQADLSLIKSRDQLVATRTKLINHVRGSLKGFGLRLHKCGPEGFARKAPAQIPAMLWDGLSAVVELIGELTARIRRLDRRINELCRDRYPETSYLMQIPGVGPITALAFILTIEDPGRFAKSRIAGAYVGLSPRRDQSGESDRQMRITKAGNRLLRRLLVTAAQYILGRFGPDCDLRRYGERIAARGGKRAKRCAVVAVARKLAVKMHRLWAGQQDYEPFVAQAA